MIAFNSRCGLCCQSLGPLTLCPTWCAALHEDLERLERVIVKDLKQDMRSFREKLKQGHRVRKRMDQMQESARKLVRTC